MPARSESQRKAMWAAKSGHSDLGIPKRVADEFLAKDAKTHACGTMYVAQDGAILLLKRAEQAADHQGVWALPGGMAEDGESLEQTASREDGEEMGADMVLGLPARKPLDVQTSGNGLAYHTYACAADRKFDPKLNGEHTEHRWAALDELPMPLHPGVMRTITDRIGTAADMQPEEWDELRENFAKWTREEQGEAEHAQDEAFAAAEALALDRGSTREVDSFGRLHVGLSNISKACVNPYRGSEIPKWRELGLDANTIYHLLRDPDELKKAAPTFNNLPILSKHQPVFAHDHAPELVIGSTGTDAEFTSDYLRNSLVIWAKPSIEGVMAQDGAPNQVKELSCGYAYRVDLTPGTFRGVRYDGVMRDIKGNHVTLVKEGRAGHDIVVGDEAMRTPAWNFGAFERPRPVSFDAFAADEKPLQPFDFSAFAADANWEEGKHPRANNGQFGAGAGKSHKEHAKHHQTMALKHEKGIEKGGREGEAHMHAAEAHHQATFKHDLAQKGLIESSIAHNHSERAHEATARAEPKKESTVQEQVAALTASRHSDKAANHGNWAAHHTFQAANAHAIGNKAHGDIQTKAAEAHRLAAQKHGEASQAHGAGGNGAAAKSAEASGHSEKADKATKAVEAHIRSSEAKDREAAAKKNDGKFGAGIGKSHAEHAEHHFGERNRHASERRETSDDGAHELAKRHHEAMNLHHAAGAQHSLADMMGRTDPSAHEASKAAHEASERTKK